MWSISVAVLIGIWLFLAWKVGPHEALGATILLSFLVPTWSTIPVFDEKLDVRMAVSLFALLAYCFHPYATFPWKLGWLDFTMLGLVGVHLFSDIENSGWSWLLPLRVYAEWCIPYIAGRLSLTERNSLRFLLPFGAGVGMLMGAGSFLEGISGEHPWEWLYGERNYDGIPRMATRWGMIRSWGCCGHAIFFGMVQLAVMPWVLGLATSLRSKGLAAIPPLLSLIGIIATGSRSVVLGFGIAVIGSIACLIPRTRIPLICLIAIGITLGVFQKDRVLDSLRRWGGEPIEKMRDSVVIDDQKVAMSGTLSRLYVLSVYRRAFVRAGWIGFGSESVEGFPVNVPIGPEDQSALQKIRFVDNQYLLISLRFGWLGCFFFTFAIVLSVIAWILRANAEEGNERRIAYFFACTLMAMGLALFTVWMPHDIGYPLLWAMGGASGSIKTREPDFQ